MNTTTTTWIAWHASKYEVQQLYHWYLLWLGTDWYQSVPSGLLSAVVCVGPAVQWGAAVPLGQYYTYYYHLMRLMHYLRRLYINKLKKSKFAIPSCSRYLARVIYKLRLNSWNSKYSQNVICVCKNILSVKHILLECPFTTELFQKKMDMT